MAFWFELEPRPIDALGLAVITNIASSYVRMGLYLPDDTGGKPGTLMVAHAGTVTTASTGHQSAAVSYTPSVLGCWAVVQVGGANGAASRSITYVNRRNLGGAAGDVVDACQLRVGRADAALPSSLAGTSWTYYSDTPHGMKVSYA